VSIEQGIVETQGEGAGPRVVVRRSCLVVKPKESLCRVCAAHVPSLCSACARQAIDDGDEVHSVPLLSGTVMEVLGRGALSPACS
jgi:hypothetical protein